MQDWPLSLSLSAFGTVGGGSTLIQVSLQAESRTFYWSVLGVIVSQVSCIYEFDANIQIF